MNKEDEIYNALLILLQSYKADFRTITGAELNDTEAVLMAKSVLKKYKPCTRN